MRLRLTGSELTELQDELLKNAPDEGAAFLGVEPSGSGLVLHSLRVFSGDELEVGSSGELTISEEAQLSALRGIKTKGHYLVEVHTHPFSVGEVHFSPYDADQLPQFARYVMNKLQLDGFGALVIGQASITGRWWRPTATESLEIEVVGPIDEIPAWFGKNLADFQDEERFDRQLRALGKMGQARIHRLRVGVIGLGGTGSQMVQQLAHLGVKDFVLVDDDKVEDTNLPRLVGANTDDVLNGVAKSTIASRIIKGQSSDAAIQCTGTLRRQETFEALADRDLVLGCVDNDGARLILSELAAAALIPYLDIGVGIEADGLARGSGGRVGFQLPKGPCLACADEIDFGEAAEDLEIEELRRIRVARGYARDRRIEPALIPLNSTVTGLAAMEILAFVTGFREVIPFWRYDAISQSVTRLNVTVNEDCPVCRPALGMGDRQAVDRYALSI